MKRDENPTLYRTPLEYSQMLHHVSSVENAGYKIIRGKSMLTYIQVRAKRDEGPSIFGPEP